MWVDLEGYYVESAWDVFSLSVGVASLANNLKRGSWKDAALDTVGVLADAGAVILPGVPGGAGAAIKAGRAAKYAAKTVKAVNESKVVVKASQAIAVSSKAQEAIQLIQRANQAINAAQGAVAGYQAYGDFREGNYISGTLNAVNAGLQATHAYSEVKSSMARGAAGGSGQLEVVTKSETPTNTFKSEGAIPPHLEAGVAYEENRLVELGLPKHTYAWRPSQDHIDSAAFKVIVGDAKYTAAGDPVGIIFDATKGGLREIKGGSSVLDSSYQLRLETYYSLKGTNKQLPFTLDTTRPVNPTFQDWLERWGVQVEMPK